MHRSVPEALQKHIAAPGSPDKPHPGAKIKTLNAPPSDYARENGIAIGKEQCIAIGEARRNAEFAAAMLVKGLDMGLICELTGLTPEEVNALRQ